MSARSDGPLADRQGPVRPSSTEGTGTCLPSAVLWSRDSARDIVRVIAQDAESGRMPTAAAMDLIDRVWARAAPDEDRASGR